jgi:hypothetical protein
LSEPISKIYQRARRLAKGWCGAWTHGDLDALMEHYAEDVRVSSPTVIKRLGIANGWIEGKGRRETGAVVVDVIELDAEGKGKAVQAFYGDS